MKLLLLSVLIILNPFIQSNDFPQHWGIDTNLQIEVKDYEVSILKELISLPEMTVKMIAYATAFYAIEHIGFTQSLLDIKEMNKYQCLLLIQKLIYYLPQLQSIDALRDNLVLYSDIVRDQFNFTLEDQLMPMKNFNLKWNGDQ